MQSKLTPEDIEYIWQVVDHAVEKSGSHANLFANRLEFFEESGRIKFCWPSWMTAIKGYLSFNYGDQLADTLLITILKEVMSEANYEAFKRKDRDNFSFLRRHMSIRPLEADDNFDQQTRLQQQAS